MKSVQGKTQGWVFQWKAIANYINCSVSTAKRYYYQHDMPVHRTSTGTPVAIIDEVDNWLIEHDERYKNKKNQFRQS
jgi:hypothetical protein